MIIKMVYWDREIWGTSTNDYARGPSGTEKDYISETYCLYKFPFSEAKHILL